VSNDGSTLNGAGAPILELSKLGVCYRQVKSKRWQVTKGRMLDNVIVSHFASQSNGKFGRPFDGVYPERNRRAQDRLTTSGSAGGYATIFPSNSPPLITKTM
jgi:hypothetical protein